MRNIVFKKVGGKNFGPYIDPIEYEIKADTLTLITGPNGVGKTMMLDIIPFTLFGITSKGMKGDDVVNNTIGKDCHTWAYLDIDDKSYIINRYQKYKGKNNVTLEEEGGETIAKGHNEVVPLLETMIQPKQLFMNTLMFGQKVKDFFTDLGDAKQKEIFRMILNLDNYLKYYENSKSTLKDINEKWEEANKQKSVYLGIISDITENLKNLEERKQEFYREKESSLKECREKLSQMERFKVGWENKLKQLEPSEEMLTNIQNEIRDIEKEITQIDEKYEVALQKIESDKNQALQRLYEGCKNKKEEKLLEFKPEIEKFNKKIENLEKQLKIENEKIHYNQSEFLTRKVEIESNIKHAQNDLSELEEAKKIGVGKCPTCKQEIKDFNHLESEMNKINIELKDYQKELQGTTLKYEGLIADLKNGAMAVESELKENAENRLKAENQLNSESKDLDQQLKEKIAKVESMAKAYKAQKMDEKPKEKKGLEDKLSQLFLTKNKYSQEVDDLIEAKNNLSKVETDIAKTQERQKYIEDLDFDKSEIDRQNKRMKEMTKSIESLQQYEKELEAERNVAQFWKDAFSPSGIPSMLIDESIPFMNEKVANYLETISNGRYIVSFDTLAETKSGSIRDKITVRVLDTKTKANTRTQFSGGQTRIVDISTILTLGDLQSKIQNVNFNILLFDEIFDSLDDENIGYVSRVLRRLTHKSIFIISHRHVDQLEADEVYSL